MPYYKLEPTNPHFHNNLTPGTLLETVGRLDWRIMILETQGTRTNSSGIYDTYKVMFINETGFELTEYLALTLKDYKILVD